MPRGHSVPCPLTGCRRATSSTCSRVGGTDAVKVRDELMDVKHLCRWTRTGSSSGLR